MFLVFFTNLFRIVIWKDVIGVIKVCVCALITFAARLLDRRKIYVRL